MFERASGSAAGRVPQGSSLVDSRAAEGCGLPQSCAWPLVEKLYKVVAACPEIRSPSPYICASSWAIMAKNLLYNLD